MPVFSGGRRRQRAAPAAGNERLAKAAAEVIDQFDRLTFVGVATVATDGASENLVAEHGGVVNLINVQDNQVFIQMGGGCQGCGQADVTLKFGIENSIRAAVAGVGDILDVTDHASGRNPYYTPSKK